MDPIEQALFAAAFQLIDGRPPEHPVEPVYDCMTQALRDTCRLYGIAEADVPRFLMSLAVKVRRLEAEVPERKRFRQVEAQMMAACGLSPTL